tara:strand:- start:1231 stop:1488 length:258 start_codon:yes stop_codon:yes gene_type:complete
MKITKSRLKEIIREEVDRFKVKEEGLAGGSTYPAERGAPPMEMFSSDDAESLKSLLMKLVHALDNPFPDEPTGHSLPPGGEAPAE